MNKEQIEELYKLIQENPDAEIKFFCDTGLDETYNNVEVNASDIYVKELTLYKTEYGNIWVDREDFKDYAYDNFAIHNPEEVAEILAKEELKRTKFKKFIVINLY